MRLIVSRCYRVVSSGARATNDRLYDLQRAPLKGTIVGLTASTAITQSHRLTPVEGYLRLLPAPALKLTDLCYVCMLC